MKTAPAIEMKKVSVSFRDQPVLEDIDLTVEKGEFLGIIGPNGAGKSVLLKVLLGLIEPDRGSVRVLGTTPSRARGSIAYVPQYARFDHTFPVQVEEVVRMGLLGRDRIFRRFSDQDRHRAGEALRMVGLSGLERKQVGSLSGGQIQRVLIARAITVNASLLLLDEPTASLDPAAVGDLYRLLDELASSMTVVLVSHDIGVMYRHVQTVACLNRKLHHHLSHDLTQEMIEETYGAQVDVVVHSHTHRVLGCHHRREER